MKNYLNDLVKTLDTLPLDKLNDIINILVRANKEKKQVFVFGNGGSAATSSHFVTDLGKGASRKLVSRFKCISLNENVAWITALANDYSYEEVFLDQLKNYALPGDVVITMSVSGNSPNLMKAFEWAKKNGLQTIAMIGGKKGDLIKIADCALVIESEHYGIVEDIHMIVSHLISYTFMEHPMII